MPPFDMNIPQKSKFFKQQKLRAFVYLKNKSPQVKFISIKLPYLKRFIIAGGAPVVPFVRAAEVMLSFIESIIGKKLLRKTKIIIGRAIATIIITMTNVLLSTSILFIIVC